MSRENRASLILASVAHGGNHIFQLILPVVLPTVAEEFGLSNLATGLLVAIYSLSYSIFQTPFGIFARQFGRRRLLCVGFILDSLVFVAIGFSRDVTSFAVLLFIAGIGGSTYHPLGISLVSDLYQERRGEALGYHQMGGSIGSFVAPLIVGTLVETIGWRSAFMALSVLGFVVAFLLWLLLEETIISITHGARPSLGSLRLPLILIFATSIYMVTLRGVQAFATKYFHDGKGVGYFEATILYSLLQIAGVISGPLSGYLSDYFGRRKIVAVLIILQSISVFGLVYSDGILLYLGCVFFGFATYGLLATSDALLIDVTVPELVGTVIGINMTLSFAVSVLIPPVLGGSIDTRGFDQSFAFMAAFSLLSLLPLRTVRVNGKRKEEQ